MPARCDGTGGRPIRQEAPRGDIKALFSRWRRDYDFRTIVNALGATLTTAVFALYNGLLGVTRASVWHGGICVYYLLLLLIRGMVLRAERRIAGNRAQARKARHNILVAAAILFLLLNLALIAPLALMVKQEKPVEMTLIPAIAMAAYTTYKVTIAAVNLKRKNRSEDSLVRLLRTINFADALVSIATLQNTLIMVSSKENPRWMLPLTAVSSGLLWAAVVALSAMNLRQTRLRPGRASANRV